MVSSAEGGREGGGSSVWSIPAAAPFQQNSLALSLWFEQLVASQLVLGSPLLQKVLARLSLPPPAVGLSGEGICGEAPA